MSWEVWQWFNLSDRTEDTAEEQSTEPETDGGKAMESTSRGTNEEARNEVSSSSNQAEEATDTASRSVEPDVIHFERPGETDPREIVDALLGSKTPWREPTGAALTANIDRQSYGTLHTVATELRHLRRDVQPLLVAITQHYGRTNALKEVFDTTLLVAPNKTHYLPIIRPYLPGLFTKQTGDIGSARVFSVDVSEDDPDSPDVDRELRVKKGEEVHEVGAVEYPDYYAFTAPPEFHDLAREALDDLGEVIYTLETDEPLIQVVGFTFEELDSRSEISAKTAFDFDWDSGQPTDSPIDFGTSNGTPSTDANGNGHESTPSEEEDSESSTTSTAPDEEGPDQWTNNGQQPTGQGSKKPTSTGTSGSTESSRPPHRPSADQQSGSSSGETPLSPGSEGQPDDSDSNGANSDHATRRPDDSEEPDSDRQSPDDDRPSDDTEKPPQQPNSQPERPDGSQQPEGEQPQQQPSTDGQPDDNQTSNDASEDGPLHPDDGEVPDDGRRPGADTGQPQRQPDKDNRSRPGDGEQATQQPDVEHQPDEGIERTPQRPGADQQPDGDDRQPDSDDTTPHKPDDLPGVPSNLPGEDNGDESVPGHGPDTGAPPQYKPGVVAITEHALNEIALHVAVHDEDGESQEAYGTLYANQQGVIRYYNPVDSEDYVLRQTTSIEFKPAFKRHLKELARHHKEINHRLCGDSHSHPSTGVPKQSAQDKIFNQRVWSNQRNTELIAGVKKGSGPDEWQLVEVDDTIEARKELAGKLVRIRAYSGTNDSKEIEIKRTMGG